MNSLNFVKKLLAFVLLFSFIFAGCFSTTIAETPKEKAIREAKLKEIERKENIQVKKLQNHQQKLEKTQTVINTRKKELKKSKKKLNKLNYKLKDVSYEHANLSNKLKKRIRNIYKGERITLLSLLLEAKDVNAFLDSIYYQQKQANDDAKLIDELKEKSQKLKNLKSSVSKEHSYINYNLRRIKREKKKLINTIYITEQMIERLRTDKETYMAAQNELARQSDALSGSIRRQQSNKKGISLSSKFMRPVSGRISSYYGKRRHPIFRTQSFHSGIDIAGRNWAPIKASNSGKVMYSGWYGGYGKVVIIEHGKYKLRHASKNTSTLYAHLAKTVVKVGQVVKKGDIVGYEGSTGYSTGPHLHFEVRIDGKTTNPVLYIK